MDSTGPYEPAPAPAPPVPVSDEEKAARVEALRSRVPGLAEDADAARFCSDATLERFTRATSYDVDKAEEFLRRTLRWRAEKRPWAAVCPGCAVSPKAHSLRCVGTDASGRPVLYHSFAQAEGRHVAAHNTQHLMRILEDCVTLMERCKPPVAQWVWVFDFHGYGLWDNNPSTVLAAAQFLPMHPNRLFKVVMLDAPSAFSTVFSVVSSFLTDITKAKISFCSLDALGEALSPWAGDEMASWLAAEAAENRALSVAGAKAVAGKCYWKGASEEGGHDPRGVASFVSSDAYFSPLDWAPPQTEAQASAAAEGEEGEAKAAAAPAARSGSWLWGGGAPAAPAAG